MAAPSGHWLHLSCTRCEAGLSWYGTDGAERPQHRCSKDNQIRGFDREVAMRAPAKDSPAPPRLRGTHPSQGVRL